MKKRAAIFLIALTTLGEGIASGQQVGDTFDQFFRYVEVKNKVIESHLPGETVDHFSGNLRIVQEDMAFPGQGGLDLRIMRVYSSKIWGRSDLFSPERLTITRSRLLPLLSRIVKFACPESVVITAR